VESRVAKANTRFCYSINCETAYATCLKARLSDILLILSEPAQMHDRKRNVVLFFRLIFMKTTA